jgi:predicted Zn finger-like uncharacterized protein
MVTRCPTCATAFRVTSTQLESAKGAVRCGSCLHIFQAQDFLVKTTEEQPPAVKTPQPEHPNAEPKVDHLKPEPIATKQKPEPAAVNKKPEPVVAQQKLEAISSQEKAARPEQAKVPARESMKPVQSKAEQPIPKKAVASTPIAPSIVQQVSEEKVSATKPIAQQSPSKTTPVIKQVVIDKAKILADEDDILISDDMDRANEKSAGYEFDGFIDLDMNPKQTVSLFEREIRYEPPRDDNNEAATDESWAEGLLDDDGEPLHQFKKPVVKSHDINVEETRDNSDTKYSGPIFSLVNENTPESSADTKDEPLFSEAFLSATRAPEPAKEPDNFAAALFDEGSDADNYNDGEESEKPSKRPVKSSKMRAFDTSRAALLMNIMPAPVEFTARRMRRYQRKLWPILAVCMSLMLLIQIAYFKFDYFSRVEPYRTVYLFICPLMGCEVPALVDTSQILATNLIVRNHPDTANALMVDAILINNAPFEQPFPDLILSFSKLDETPVASRRFTPKEYIGGELAGMKYIPQRQPVHITLEISDPGPEAVNYTLATH